MTLTRTVALAIERLESRPRRFLLLCSFLDPGCIWPELFPDLPSTRFETLMEELGAVSLTEAASMMDGKRGRSVHPAVHKIIRHIALQQNELERCITIAFSNVARALPDDLDTDVADKQRQILPHVEQCRQNLDLFHKYELRVAPELLPCLGTMGWLLYQRGQLDDAVAFYDLALRTYESLATHHLTKRPIAHDSPSSNERVSAENTSPYRDADYYIIINSYGLVYKERGDLNRAQRCFHIVRDSFEETSALKDMEDDLSQGVLNINLALSLRQSGHLEKARNLLRTALVFYEHQQDEDGAMQKCKIKQYLGSIYKLEAEYYKATMMIEEACAGLSVHSSDDSLLLAIAKKELGSVYLLWDEPEHDCLANAQRCFEIASVGITKHCRADSNIYIDLQWHQHMLLMAQARRSEVDRTLEIQAACDAFDAFITTLNARPKDDPIKLHALRTYGKWLQKLERWEDGQARLLSAIEGYQMRNNHQLDHAFAHKDIADGFFRRFDLGHHAAGLPLLERATQHYRKARSLFESLHPDYAVLFIVNIDKKLEAIHFRLTVPAEELHRLRKRPSESRGDEYLEDVDSSSSSRSSGDGNSDPNQSPAFVSRMRDWIYELI
jgi:tetratricopeptide (TPR) repeat protein